MPNLTTCNLTALISNPKKPLESYHLLKGPWGDPPKSSQAPNSNGLHPRSPAPSRLSLGRALQRDELLWLQEGKASKRNSTLQRYSLPTDGGELVVRPCFSPRRLRVPGFWVLRTQSLPSLRGSGTGVARLPAASRSGLSRRLNAGMTPYSVHDKLEFLRH